MGIRAWLYWIDRALAGDRRTLAAIAAWLAILLVLAATLYLTR